MRTAFVSRCLCLCGHRPCCASGMQQYHEIWTVSPVTVCVPSETRGREICLSVTPNCCVELASQVASLLGVYRAPLASCCSPCCRCQARLKLVLQWLPFSFFVVDSGPFGSSFTVALKAPRRSDICFRFSCGCDPHDLILTLCASVSSLSRFLTLQGEKQISRPHNCTAVQIPSFCRFARALTYAEFVSHTANRLVVPSRSLNRRSFLLLLVLWLSPLSIGKHQSTHHDDWNPWSFTSR